MSITTIQELAKAAGVSPSTASKALNGYKYVKDATRQKVLDAARRLNFTPNYFAKSLINKRTNLLGILIEDNWGAGLTHPLFGGVIEGFKRATEAAGYESLLMRNDFLNGDGKANSHCRQRGIEGVLIVVANSGNPAVWEIVDDLPCVSVDLTGDNLSAVLSDNVKGGFDATDYLLKLGHRKIAHIAGNDDKPAGRDRRAGYEEALRRAGVEVDERLIVPTRHYFVGEGKDAIKALSEKGADYTAIFAASDSLAYGASAALRELGRNVPDDVSIVGFDDIDTAAYFSPPLTTMRQDRVGMGKRAGETLVRLVKDAFDGKPYKTSVEFLPADLMERGSVRKMREEPK